MRDRGYSRYATQCCVKLKELRQAHQKTKESDGRSGTEPKTCYFYAELHAILGGAATTTPPLSVDSDDGVLSTMPEDFANGEDEEEEEDELEENTQHIILPNSQDLFITLTEIPSQPNEAREGTSGGGSAGTYLSAEEAGAGSRSLSVTSLPQQLNRASSSSRLQQQLLLFLIVITPVIRLLVFISIADQTLPGPLFDRTFRLKTLSICHYVSTSSNLKQA
ncbi:hypothetical protein UY3_07460 [Chelonia mydas]|uniref:Myb/SANT-like DNA-binding domain-containing protein n=1 Tax=Chelonia mydas TaxID=8469 RepID=M7BC19_CHEMY|nr:hypothetical protein UY3_07460 [Chelonia mydas]